MEGRRNKVQLMYLLSGRQRQVGRGNTGPMGFYGVGALADDQSSGDYLASLLSGPTGTANVNTLPVQVPVDASGNEVGVSPGSISNLPSSTGSGQVGITVSSSPFGAQSAPASGSSSFNWSWLILGGGALVFVMAMSGGRR